jgi:hypothetical protein
MAKRSILILTLTAAIAAAATLALAATASATREVVEVGNLFLADNGGIFPSTLPRHESAPVTARLEGEIGTRDGSHPPAVRTIDLDVDKTIDLDAVGLPVCKPGQLASRATDTAKRACPDAIVGSGTAEVEVAFPEQKPFSATGPIVVFNGGVHGGTTLLLLHAYVNVPAPTAIVTTAKITRIHKGAYGMHIEAQIPKIAGGAGSVTKFTLRVGRSFTYKGKKQSLLTASCPSGHYTTEGRVRFADGTGLGLTHVFPCTPTDH